VLLHWRDRLRGHPITEGIQAADVALALRRVRTTKNKALTQQIAALDQELAALDERIAISEGKLNGLAIRLYDLAPAEVAIMRGETTQ